MEIKQDYQDDYIILIGEIKGRLYTINISSQVRKEDIEKFNLGETKDDPILISKSKLIQLLINERKKIRVSIILRFLKKIPNLQ